MRTIRTFWKFLLLDSEGSAENTSSPGLFIVTNRALSFVVATARRPVLSYRQRLGRAARPPLVQPWSYPTARS